MKRSARAGEAQCSSMAMARREGVVLLWGGGEVLAVVGGGRSSARMVSGDGFILLSCYLTVPELKKEKEVSLCVIRSEQGV